MLRIRKLFAMECSLHPHPTARQTCFRQRRTIRASLNRRTTHVLVPSGVSGRLSLPGEAVLSDQYERRSTRRSVTTLRVARWRHHSPIRVDISLTFSCTLADRLSMTCLKWFHFHYWHEEYISRCRYRTAYQISHSLVHRVVRLARDVKRFGWEQYQQKSLKIWIL